jgi:cardiolipin synthase
LFDLSQIWSITAGLVWLAVLLLTLLHILYTKRGDPAEALVWILAVVFLHVFGLVLYLFFGITRLRHVDTNVSMIRSKVDNDQGRFFGRGIALITRHLKQFHPSPEVANLPHNRMFDRLFPNCVPLAGNSVEVLTDGSGVYPRMLEDIAAATATIRLQSFIFTSDELGTKILRALLKKADEGVDVKVMFDSVGSLKLYFSGFFLKCLLCRRPNFAMRAFSPINLLAPWKFQLRNHRKLMVIDGRIAYSGGINISEENENRESVPANRHIHDLHCRILGPAVSQFTLSFLHDWVYTTRRKLTECARPGDFSLPEAHGDTVIRVLDSGPGSNYMGTQKLFFAAAALAQRSLWIMTPYLVPGPEYIDALCVAAARGVSVKVIVPKENDHFFVDYAAKSFYGKLLRSGVKIYEKNGCFSHIKALVVDSEWGFMGSSNCDRRSFRLNFELDFCFERSEFVGTMAHHFQSELAASDAVKLDQLDRKSAFRRLAENVCALLTPLL